MADPSPKPPDPSLRPYQFTILGLLLLTTGWAILLGIMRSMELSVPAMVAVSQFFAGAGLVILGSARWRLWLVFLGFFLVWTAWAGPLLWLVIK
jgi:hypothetical protein